MRRAETTVMVRTLKDPVHTRLRILFWCAAMVLGAADTWSTRFTMNPDGIHYLDLGEAYLRGDWQMALNAWWGPLYALVLGLLVKLLKPTAYWEFPLVHLANFLIYLAALRSFEFFLRGWIDGRKKSPRTSSENPGAPLPEWAWWTLGYSIFIWTSLDMITIRLISPDMCVAAFVYLVAGLALRIRGRDAPRRTFVLLGIVLGFAYLTKAVFFPLAFVFLGMLALSIGTVPKIVPRLLLSTLIFLAITSPLIVALSRAKGRPTFGDSGRVDYTVYVNGVDLFFPDSAALKHPARKLFDLPPTYEYATPVGGTYPPGYDFSYWHDGIDPYFDLRQQLAAMVPSLKLYCVLFFSASRQLNICAGLLLLYLMSSRPSSCLKSAAVAGWPLAIPALAGLGLYALVVTDPRFVGAFVCLLWIAAFSGVSLPVSGGLRRWAGLVIVAIAAITGALAASSTLGHVLDPAGATPVYWRAASALQARGVGPGDKLAVIGNEAFGAGGAFVARLARAQIIAEVRRPDIFWATAAITRSRTIDTLARLGVKAVLIRGGPAHPVADIRLEKLGETDYCMLMLEN